MMMSVLLSRAIRALCMSGAALGMTAAVAQETSVTLENAGYGWTENVVAYSDPEGEVTNGTDPPFIANNVPEAEVDNDLGSTMESYNLPESEVNNGLKPGVNP